MLYKEYMTKVIIIANDSLHSIEVGTSCLKYKSKTSPI